MLLVILFSRVTNDLLTGSVLQNLGTVSSSERYCTCKLTSSSCAVNEKRTCDNPGTEYGDTSSRRKRSSTKIHDGRQFLERQDSNRPIEIWNEQQLKEAFSRTKVCRIKTKGSLYLRNERKEYIYIHALYFKRIHILS